MCRRHIHHLLPAMTTSSDCSGIVRPSDEAEQGSTSQPECRNCWGYHLRHQVTTSHCKPHPDRVGEDHRDDPPMSVSRCMMSPELAQKLAGKIVFLTATVFGQLGRGLLAPLYGRAHHLGPSGKCSLTNALRVALHGVLQICQNMKPTEDSNSDFSSESGYLH